MKTALGIVLVVIALCLPATAQVTAGATASAIDYQGAWNIGTEQTQQHSIHLRRGSEEQRLLPRCA